MVSKSVELESLYKRLQDEVLTKEEMKEIRTRIQELEGNKK